jgi:hypothetical protein
LPYNLGIDLFTDKRQKREHDKNRHIQELYQQISQLELALGWNKKIWAYPLNRRISSFGRIIEPYSLPGRRKF